MEFKTLLFTVVGTMIFGLSSKVIHKGGASGNKLKTMKIAKPENVASNISLEKIHEINTFFSKDENKVKIQFASDETKYAWQNIPEFYNVARIAKGEKRNDLTYRIDDNIENIKYINRKGEQLSVNSHFEKYPIDAMIVVKNGEVRYERYQTMREHDQHIWFSVSKVVGSTMLAFLEMERKVDVKKPVSEYLVELKGSVWDTVTVEEALDMATGLNGTEHDEPLEDSRTNPNQIWYQWAATNDIGIFDNKGLSQKWDEVLREMERVKPAYTAFEYNSINTFVINRIVERVGERPLNEQLRERIWSKMGMDHDANIVMSPSGNALGFMGMNSTLRDLARFGMAFTPSSEKLAGERVIPQAIMNKIHDRSKHRMYAKGNVGKLFVENFPRDKNIANRYQWDAVFEDGAMLKKGVGGQGLYISPKDDLVIAWFCTGTGADQEETMARTIAKALENND
ncbi:serine hydrolase domain-containing protein [Sediminitomix flava]|uniref:Beta-lactamase-related domain-containing protein n=1 Tax=Sediminitomix flava TaxID=379075 RepID=A0A315Z6Y7_SEDFL|nr:serine hydrolase domain-containing protein [Sediminitomix flava]PWJ38525.1 hypothetical protein BC781_107115 [Sediminitomix flava]